MPKLRQHAAETHQAACPHSGGQEAARTAQADKLAPYEWTAANLYFAKSKEEVGYSDFEQAVDYGKKAVDFATRARDTALKVGRRNEASPSDPPVPTP